jgi:hypothetical protein
MRETVKTVKVRVPDHPNEYVIVNADDPRAVEQTKPEPQQRRRTRSRKAD